MDKSASAIAEFSRVISVEKVEEDDLVETITADAGERAALAKRFGIVSLDALGAELTLRRIGKGPAIRLEGRLKADVVQSCVVSLEPIASRIEERFAVLYAPEARVATLRGGPVVPLDFSTEEDWPEPILDGRIDIGEAVAQQLALALDPYPRKPGITLEDVIGKEKTLRDPRAESPFAKLAGLEKGKH